MIFKRECSFVAFTANVIVDMETSKKNDQNERNKDWKYKYNCMIICIYIPIKFCNCLGEYIKINSKKAIFSILSA